MFHRDFVSGRVGAVKWSTVNLMLYDGFCIAVFRLFPVGTGSESGKSIVRNPLRILLLRHRCPGIFWGCFGCLLLMLRTSFEDASDAFFGCFGHPSRMLRMPFSDASDVRCALSAVRGVAVGCCSPAVPCQYGRCPAFSGPHRAVCGVQNGKMKMSLPSSVGMVICTESVPLLKTES